MPREIRLDGEPTILPPGRETVTLQEFPAIHSQVFETEKGTLYLKQPAAALILAPAVNLAGMEGFLSGFPDEYGFSQYLDDPTPLPPAEAVSKASGQICYASYGEKRTYNQDAQRYIDNIISSGHGSVLEHATFSVLLYGISRSCSHELVRHRAGTGFSQLSQRYVSGRVLRFVERPEYQNDPELHQEFEARIDEARARYESLAERLAQRQIEGYTTLSAESRTDQRKRVQQTARSVLPNETETAMIMSGNVRAWRHIISMRVNEHAESEIRMAMFNVFQILKQSAPILFSDYQTKQLPDGTFAVETPYPKV